MFKTATPISSKRKQTRIRIQNSSSLQPTTQKRFHSTLKSSPHRSHSTIQSHSSPISLLNTRQLHPTHIYGSKIKIKPQFEKSPIPAAAITPTEFKPTHIQYISGYEFLPISNVPQVKKTLTQTLQQYNTLGRIYIDSKGINLQMCTHPSLTQDVIHAVRTIENGLFSNTRIFANDIMDTNEIPPLFDKLTILERRILNDGLDTTYSDQLNPFIEKFNHLEPSEWHQTLAQTANTTNPQDKPIVLDIRNLYEYELGSFEAIAVDVDAYRDTFPILDTILGIQHPQGQIPYDTSSSNNNNDDNNNNENDNQSNITMKKTKKQLPNHNINNNNTQQQQQLQSKRIDEPVQLIKRSQLTRQEPTTAVRHSTTTFELEHQQQTLDIGRKLQALYPPNNNDNNNIETKPSTNDLPPSQSIVNINKDKKLMLFCTGGIRCLKVGSYLHHQGFTDVNVLNGGINAYSIYAQNNPQETQLFNGSNVVFDQRRAVTIGKDMLSHCHQCHDFSNVQRNCVSCDILFIQCKSCEDLYNGTCSLQCSEDYYGLGEQTRSIVKSHGLTPIITPPIKSRIRPRLQPYSITQNAPYLDNIDIIQNQIQTSTQINNINTTTP